VKSTSYILTNKTIRYKIYGIIGALLTLIIPYIIMKTNPHIESSQSFCPFKLLTGLPCPGCGITKSIVFFYQGDIYKSLYYHILGPVVVLFSILLILLLVTEIITQRDYFNSTIFYNKNLAYALGIMLGIYHLIRTIYFIYGHSLHEIMKESVWG